MGAAEQSVTIRIGSYLVIAVNCKDSVTQGTWSSYNIDK